MEIQAASKPSPSNAGSDSGESDMVNVNPEEVEEVFDEFWSSPPEHVGAHLKSLEEAERSRRGSRGSSLHYASDQEVPGGEDREQEVSAGGERNDVHEERKQKLPEGEDGTEKVPRGEDGGGRGESPSILKMASEIVKRLEEEDAIQEEVSEAAARLVAQSGEPPGLIVEEIERTWGGKLTEGARQALERLTQHQGWPEGINWGVPGGRWDQVGESKPRGNLDSPQEAEVSVGGNPGGEEVESKPRGRITLEPISYVGESSGQQIEPETDSEPSPTSPLDANFEGSSSPSPTESGTRDEWSPEREGETIGGEGDKGGLKRVDSWYEKSFRGKAMDVMRSLVHGWWADYPEWPALV